MHASCESFLSRIPCREVEAEAGRERRMRAERVSQIRFLLGDDPPPLPLNHVRVPCSLSLQAMTVLHALRSACKTQGTSRAFRKEHKPSHGYNPKGPERGMKQNAGLRTFSVSRTTKGPSRGKQYIRHLWRQCTCKDGMKYRFCLSSHNLLHNPLKT